MKNIYLILFIAILCGSVKTVKGREYISLQGEWQFALDTFLVGEKQKWYLADFDDSVILPGTTDLNKKGYLNRDTTTLHLNRVYTYEGAAWYRKEVVIPENFKDKHLQLVLERTKSTKIWIDSIFAGECRLLQSPQVFDVSEYLTPGKHYITIMVNNDLKLTPYGNVHIYSDDTQTNWNGILGKMYIEAAPGTYISNLQVYPDIDNKKIEIELGIENGHNIKNIDIELQVEKKENGKITFLKPFKINTICRNDFKLEYQLDDECSLWDEYNQPLYKLTVIISGDKIQDSKSVPFGMRKFKVKGKQFGINGRTVFLRGKHEAAVFPLTGFTPMNTEDWVRIFRIAKSYGINHYRFHSYCPPDAAFAAADQEGIYLQAELPFWGGLESDTVADNLKAEGYAMLNAYVNHPSFVMFSHGNEIWSGHDRVEANIIALKEYDSRPLYTMGCNNNIGFVAPRECSDFYVGARTPYDYDTIHTHTRLTHAYADSKHGGILNTQTPSTQVTYEYPVSQLNIPIVSHEIGQYQIYPDYREIEKYTGVLRARNLEIFQNSLDRAGMAHMDSIFQKASGAWSAICYKAEMEAAIRTEGLAGFQLLDLQDFPGQGTALVGILDAFMDSKHVITKESWKQSCNDVVILIEFPKYCWSGKENFNAKIRIANYSGTDIRNDLVWSISSRDGEILKEGEFSGLDISQGKLQTAGELSFGLSSVEKAQKLTVKASLPGTLYQNEYNIWVYPSTGFNKNAGDIMITRKLDDETFNSLHNGKKVLFFPQTNDVTASSYPGLFPPDFWNYGMFKGISEWKGTEISPGTLGLLTDPNHPLFKDFPTEFHTNWQWFSIIKKSNSFILDKLPHDYYPIVQVIDNLERNHKLGLIFEFKIGEGKMLVCMSQLDQMDNNPEAGQLYQSIINYMESEFFKPDYEITTGELTELFQ